MPNITQLTVDGIYEHFKRNKYNDIYDEEVHAKILIKVMLDPNQGTHNAFCINPGVMIHERTFYKWVREHEFFGDLYYFTRMIAREIWEEEGRKVRDTEYQLGTINYSFEHWKLIGWSRFGISKNSRLKINIDPNANPAQHYASILRQASEGDFTAAEFKQLMEAVNVGLNVHQVFELQKQIDELKSDLGVMTANTNVKNPFSDKGTKKKD